MTAWLVRVTPPEETMGLATTVGMRYAGVTAAAAGMAASGSVAMGCLPPWSGCEWVCTVLTHGAAAPSGPAPTGTCAADGPDALTWLGSATPSPSSSPALSWGLALGSAPEGCAYNIHRIHRIHLYISTPVLCCSIHRVCDVYAYRHSPLWWSLEMIRHCMPNIHQTYINNSDVFGAYITQIYTSDAARNVYINTSMRQRPSVSNSS